MAHPSKQVFEFIKHVARSVTVAEALSILRQCSEYNLTREVYTTAWYPRPGEGSMPFQDIGRPELLHESVLHVASLWSYNGPPNDIRFRKIEVWEYVADCLLWKMAYGGEEIVSKIIQTVVARGAP